MEITIDRDQLYRSVSRVQSIIEKRSNMPILSMVLISTTDGAIEICATDLEISFQQKLPAKIISPGSLTISGRKLFEILKESKSKDIYIKENENNWVFITDQDAKYNLACMPADEYPVFVEPEDVPTIEIEGKILQEMISKTIYSVTMDDAGFKLSGIFVEKVPIEGRISFRMVSTDGHRLSMIDKFVEGIDNLIIEGGIMIPRKGMAEIAKMASEEGNVNFGIKKNNCVVKGKDNILVIRLLESKFPDYNAVIPKKQMISLNIARASLLNGMRKMIILSSETYKGVKITLEDNNMELVSINPDLGDVQENIEVEYHSERLEAGFNAAYFIEALQAMESENVELGFVDSSSPCLLRGEKDKGFIGLIMPMRL